MEYLRICQAVYHVDVGYLRYVKKDTIFLGNEQSQDVRRSPPLAKSKLYEQQIQNLSSTYAAPEWLFDLGNEQS